MLHPIRPEQREHLIAWMTMAGAEQDKLAPLLGVLLLVGLACGVWMLLDWRKRQWGNIPANFAAGAAICLAITGWQLLNHSISLMFTFFTYTTYVLGVEVGDATRGVSMSRNVTPILEVASFLLSLALAIMSLVTVFRNWRRSRRKSVSLQKVVAYERIETDR